MGRPSARSTAANPLRAAPSGPTLTGEVRRPIDAGGAGLADGPAWVAHRAREASALAPRERAGLAGRGAGALAAEPLDAGERTAFAGDPGAGRARGPTRVGRRRAGVGWRGAAVGD